LNQISAIYNWAGLDYAIALTAIQNIRNTVATLLQVCHQHTADHFQLCTKQPLTDHTR